MKALSIKQPWAYLIAKGYKDIENRDWPTNYRGRIYIHASLTFDSKGLEWLTSNSKDVPNEFVAEAKIGDTSAYEVLMELEPCNLDDYPRGAIIGEVDIVDCRWQQKHQALSPWAEINKYGFVLANAVRYDKPIPYRGQLGLFEVEL